MQGMERVLIGHPRELVECSLPKGVIGKRTVELEIERRCQINKSKTESTCT